MARQHTRRGQAIQWEDRVALAALFVHIGAVAGGDIEMFFLGHLQQRAIHARIEFVVDIRKREIFAAGGGEAGIARDRDALVFLLQHWTFCSRSCHSAITARLLSVEPSFTRISS